MTRATVTNERRHVTSRRSVNYFRVPAGQPRDRIAACCVSRLGRQTSYSWNATGPVFSKRLRDILARILARMFATSRECRARGVWRTTRQTDKRQHNRQLANQVSAGQAGRGSRPTRRHPCEDPREETASVEFKHNSVEAKFHGSSFLV